LLFVGALVLSAAPQTDAQQFVLQRLHRAIPSESDQSTPFAIGDVDGDGAVDLFTRTSEPWTESRVLLGDGSGVFRELPGAFPGGASSSVFTSGGFALGDLDQDGDLDLVEFFEGGAGLHLNDGSGRFFAVSHQLPPIAGYPVAARFLDAEGDGDVDVLLARSDAASLLLLNDGAATFTTAPAGVIDDSGPTIDVEIGDVDGDGDDDVVFGFYDPLGASPPRLARNQGGTFVEAPFPSLLGGDNEGQIELFDVDQDQDLDVIVASGAGPEWMRNDGAGGFSSAGFLPAPVSGGGNVDLYNLLSGDVDGDGDVDLVAGVFNAAITTVTYVNDGSGGFTLGAGIPEDAVGAFSALADVDGDQDLDAVWRSDLLFLNDGQGGFADADALSGDATATEGASSIALADADGDGDRDLFAAPGGYLVNEHGTLVPSANGPKFVGTLIGVADLDGDGDVDALNGVFGAPAFHLFLGDGAGGFADATATLPALGFRKLIDLDLADLDGDGDVDVLAESTSAGILLRNIGGALFVDDSGVLPPLGGEREQILVDVDGDGDVDLVRGSQHTLYRNDGAGGFALDPSALPEPGELPWTVAAGDIDADGDADLVWGYAGFANARLYVNDGTGTFTDATPVGLLFVQEPTSALALADLDGDGDLDLYQGTDSGCVPYTHPTFGPLCLPITGGQDRVYRNLGNGEFALASGMLQPYFGLTVDVAVDDLDGDGDVDLVLAHGDFYGKAVGVLRNTTRQVAWRGAPRIGKPLAMDLYGAPLAPWFLGASANVASVPLSGLGTLGIDPTTPILSIAGMLDFDGRATASLNVPTIPALVGVPAYWQGLVGSPQLRFTNVETTTFTDL